jgi:mannose-6-phosphate isomerase
VQILRQSPQLFGRKNTVTPPENTPPENAVVAVEVAPAEHPILRIEPSVQRYVWGSYDALPAFLGIEATGEPMAEAWFGTHPGGPTRVLAERSGERSGDRLCGDAGCSLAEVTAGDPQFWFGPDAKELSFLLKVLAIGHPLSLQMHPTLEEARIGFADEERRGISRVDPTRVFRDANHKPELICALTEIDALCGFRPVEESVAFLNLLGGWIAEHFVAEIRGGTTIRSLVARALSTNDDLVGATFLARTASISELAQRADRLLLDTCPPKFLLAATWLSRLGRQYPADGGVAVAALLNCLRLNPGEALFLDAGNMHAYLSGLGVEIMANSDNVIRGGMTSKHIDVDVLTRLVDTEPLTDPVIRATRSTLPGGAVIESWPVPVPDFAISRVSVTPNTPGNLPACSGLRMVLCAEGSVSVAAADATVPLAKGQAIAVAAATQLAISGYGKCFLASPG